MSIIDSISLFTIMITLAVIPSTSVALVITRSATLGVSNGIAVSLGIVLGDLVFILLAILGLSFITETMAGLFLAIKYLGGAYLLWIGFTLLTSKNKAPLYLNKENNKGDLIASLLSGLMLTLGDIKAIFFYVSLLPTFVDLSSVSNTDILTIVMVTIITVGGVKITYAFTARKIVNMSRDLNLDSGTKKVAGSFMIGTGCYLIIKTWGACN